MKAKAHYPKLAAFIVLWSVHALADESSPAPKPAADKPAMISEITGNVLTFS